MNIAEEKEIREKLQLYEAILNNILNVYVLIQHKYTNI